MPTNYGSFTWPETSGGGSGSNASVGANGTTAPSSSTEVGFVDAGGALRPFSGVSAASGPNVAVTSTVLPTGAATSANQVTEIASLSSIDGKTPALVSGRVPVDGSGVTQPISAVSLPLPAGAASAALQTTGNTSLSSIDGKTPALGQALSAASVPVVLPAAQVTALTPPTTVTANQGTGGASAWKVDGSAVTQPVSASTLPLPSGASTSALQTTISGQLPTTLGQKTSTNSLAVTIASDQTTIPVKATSGTLTDGSASTSATPSTSTQIFAANSSRRYLLIQNLSTVATIYINFTSAATAGAGSLQLLPGGSFVQESTYVSTEIVTVLSATASVPFTAKQG